MDEAVALLVYLQHKAENPTPQDIADISGSTNRFMDMANNIAGYERFRHPDI